MNRACCWMLAILGALCLILFISGAIFIGSLGKLGSKRVAVQTGSYLVLDLSGRITEHETSPRPDFLGGRKAPTLSRILQALEYAARDPRIAGVVLRPSFAGGFADLREVREAIRRFKASGKPVYAYLEMGTDRDYYLASVADTIAMNPAKSGGLVMLGVGVSSTYLRRTFEKVGLKFHVLHVGDYKGAYENLGRSSMSGPLRESLQALLDDLFEIYAGEIASSRPELDSAGLEQTLWHGDSYLITGAHAKTMGLVDLVTDWTEFESVIKVTEKFNQVSVADYARIVPRARSEGDEVAVVFAEGGISHGAEDDELLPTDEGITTERMLKLLKRLREKGNVKAVVLRVNSPGGSALASDIILAELRRLRAAKPLVVSMGNIAASGGYYIACEANHIVAQPNTITGSIGVVGVVATAEGLYDKIEARVETVERGKWVNFFRPDQDLSIEQQKVLTDLMRGVYEEFVGHVSEAREMSVEDVDRVAQGRIWTGRQALERKLVDELGGLDEAVARACELANLKRDQTSIRFYPEPKDLLSVIVDRLGSVARNLAVRWMLSPSELETRMALDYALRFVQQREFIQTLAPIQGIE